ncbi:hypothetical protein [Janthinobacterium sp. AD80]|uniref:hypothetical protein n=1 Tax=Janthinobacterium sp. AD80 TaxID=1528773 RepID=UPI0015E14EBA|nr:hypothetical protein [Janthinobacterium sp. AD80]
MSKLIPDKETGKLEPAYVPTTVNRSLACAKKGLQLWNSQHLLDDCPYCLAAHNAIQQRKVARKRLGAARRAVTMIGKSS